MNPPGINKRRRAAFLAFPALLLALALALALVLRGKRTSAPAPAVDTEVEGVNLTYLSFNKGNEKKLEVRCRESKKEGERWLRLKEVVATIYKADKLDEDIRITADSGRTTQDFNDFDLHGHAVISSPSFTLAGERFSLKALNVLSTKDPVTVQLKDLAVQAGEGIQYSIANKFIKLTAVKGILRRSGVPYDFRARTLRVNEKKKLLILSEEVVLDGNGASLQGERVSLQFDDAFENLESAGASGRSHFLSRATREGGAAVSREITADKILLQYDGQGRLQLIKVNGNGVVNLVSGKDSGTLRSDRVVISLDPETQSLDRVKTQARAELASRGRNNVTVGADILKANYSKDGALDTVIADDLCQFATDDFSGSSSHLVYNARASFIRIFGANTSITSGKNVFQSIQFHIRGKARELETKKGVKARLIPGKKSVLLGARPVFVTADGMELRERGDAARFMNRVALFQEETELHAGELLFASRDNRIACRGGADLKFTDAGERVSLSGQAIAFDPAGMKLVIEGNAQLQQGPNRLGARKIELGFDRENRLQTISASERVSFAKEGLAGRAQSLAWLYSQKVVVFKGGAEITRKDAGTTRGQELRFDLASNEITVSGAGDRSETTIRQELP